MANLAGKSFIYSVTYYGYRYDGPPTYLCGHEHPKPEQAKQNLQNQQASAAKSYTPTTTTQKPPINARMQDKPVSTDSRKSSVHQFVTVPNEGYRLTCHVDEAPAAQARSILSSLTESPNRITRYLSADNSHILILDTASQQAKVDGRQLTLPSTRLCILQYLLVHENEPVGRATLLQHILATMHRNVSPQDFDAIIDALGATLGDPKDNPHWIQHLAGNRYRFIGHAEQSSANAKPSPSAADETPAKQQAKTSSKNATQGTQTAQSPSLYFREIIRQPLISFESIPESLRSESSFMELINHERRQGRLYPYDNETWITRQGLYELGITPSDVGSFVATVPRSCAVNRLACVTISWLKKFASDVSLIKHGLSDQFYESILDSSESVCHGKLCGTALYARYKHNARGDRLVTSLVETGRSMQLDTLLDELNEDFGIPITRQRLIPLIRNTTLYLSLEADRVYASHTQFVREVE